jgi:hypothetical protein
VEETIFDYNVTEQELRFLYVKYTSKEDYLINTPVKKVMQDLYVLFRMREDTMRAGSIRKKLFEHAA